MAGEGDPWHIGRVSSYQQLFSICCFKKHFFNFLFSNVSGYLLLGARGVPGGGRSGMVPIGQYKIAKFKQQQHPPPKKKKFFPCVIFSSLLYLRSPPLTGRTLPSWPEDKSWTWQVVKKANNFPN